MKERDLLLVCVIIALFVRIFLLFAIGDTDYLSGISLLHAQFGHNLLAGTRFAGDVVFSSRPQGYGLLLALTTLLTQHESYIYLRLFQSLVDSLSCVIIFYLGKLLFDRRVGLVSAFLYASFMPSALLSIIALPESFSSFLLLTLMWLFLKGIKENSNKLIYLSSLFVSIECYLKGQFLTLPFALLFIMLIYRQHKVRDNIVIFLKYYFLVYLLLSPWIITVYTHTGQIMPFLRTQYWQGVWEGFGEDETNPFGAVWSDDKTLQQIKSEGYDVVPCSLGYDAILRDKSIDAIKKEPLWVLRLFAIRLFTNPTIGLYRAANLTPINNENEIIFLIYGLFNNFSILIVIATSMLALVFIVANIKAKNYKDIFILYIIPCFIFLPLILVHLEARYIIPVLCLLIIPAAAMIVKIIDKLKHIIGHWQYSRMPPRMET